MRCIYCKSEAERSREHVLQQALGGNLTSIEGSPHDYHLLDVCSDCNHGFSGIDAELAERHPLVALGRVGLSVASQPTEQLGGDHFIFCRQADDHLDVRVASKMRPIMLPQLLVVEEQVKFFATESQQSSALMNLLRRRSVKPDLSGVHIKLPAGDVSYCKYPRIVQHRKNDLFVRAPDIGSARIAIATVVANLDTLEEQILRMPPAEQVRSEAQSVQVTSSFCLDDSNRAVAKFVFNYLCVRLGAGFVLRQEFDELRQYIRGLSIVHPDTTDKDVIAVDTRFVVQTDEGACCIPTTGHTILISDVGGFLVAMVSLYGCVNFVVRLGRMTERRRILVAHEFTTDRSANRKLELAEVAKRLHGACSTG